MQRLTAILAILVLLLTLSCLTGCGEKEPVVTNPTVDATIPETDPAPTLTLPQRYAKALRELNSVRNLLLTYTASEARDVAGETFTAHSKTTATYAGLNTPRPEALIQEELTYGTYRNIYYQSYMNGSAFSRVNNNNFSAALTIEEFMAQQLPLAVLDEDLYSSITETAQEDGTFLLVFEDASALEKWISGWENAQLITAKGSAVLNADDELTSFTYHAEYTIGVATYALDLAVDIQIPESADLTGQHPVYGENCAAITDLRIPKYLLKTVGDVYTAQAMTVTYTDAVHSQAFNQNRSQNNQINTFGSGETFMGSISSQVTVKDFSGVPTVNNQNVSFINGVYNYSINGADPVPDTSVTGDSFRAICEDSILSGLMTLSTISGAEIRDVGDFLCITFIGTEDFAETICSGIYTLFGMDLDIWATSYTTDAAGGYLTISKQTGLPTAMGISMKRTHIIDGVPYALTYQVDQGLTIPSLDAYENITGAPQEDTSSTEPIAPLFYKVTDENGKTMWLLGTIDVGDSRSRYLPKEILEALAAADALAVSYDPTQFRQQISSDSTISSQLTAAYYYSDGGMTKDHLPEDLYGLAQYLMLASGSNSINTPYMKVVLWEDLIADLYLRQSYSLSIRESVDNRLLELAASQAKPIYEIESGLTHLQLATHLSRNLQTGILSNRIQTGLTASNAYHKELYDAWCAGDEEKILSLLTIDESNLSEDEQLLIAEYRTIMHTKHNKGLLKAAQGYLSGEETIFYAVDIAHLLGSDGLVAALQNAGYTVEPVSYN